MLSIFLISLQSVLIIITIIIVGFFLEKSSVFSSEFSSDLSNLVVMIALPISIFLSTQRYITKKNFLLLTKGTVLVMLAILLCFVMAIYLSRILRLNTNKRSIFINGFVNSNTLFVGLPLNIALFGSKSLPYFLCYFVANTIATWGIGVKIINADAPKREIAQQTNNTVKKIFNIFTPPMWGFIIGLICFAIGFKTSGFINKSFSYLASLVTPLSLIFLGLQLGKVNIQAMKIDKLDILAQFGKFIVAPLSMFAIIQISKVLNIVSLNPLFTKTLLVQSVTPMLTLLPVMAEQAKLDVSFATKILTQSIIIFPFILIILMLFL
jgi:predicted permease